jgi:hypothetical protein
MGLLLRQNLAYRQWQILLQGIGIGIFGRILALLGSGQQAVIVAAQLCFQIAPDAMQRTGRGAGLLDVVKSVLMKNLFEIAAKARSFQRLGKEVSFQRLILQVIAYLCESLLAIDKNIDYRRNGKVHLVSLVSVGGHEISSLSKKITGVKTPVGQGPPAVCDSPSPAASRRNRENSAPLPTGLQRAAEEPSAVS